MSTNEQRLPQEEPGRESAKRWVITLWLTVVGSGLVILFSCNFHQDEHFYAYAVRLASQGQILYRDFYFNQTPVMPYAYAPMQWLLPGNLLALRLLTLALGAAGLAVLARVAWHRFGPMTAVFLLLFSLNGGMQYLFSTTKIYALGTLFLALSLAFVWPRKWRPWYAVAAGVLMALAVLTRLSFLPGLPLLVIYMACRSDLPGNRWMTATLAAAGGGAALAAIAGVFIWLAPYEFYMNIYAVNASAGVAADEITMRRILWGLIPFGSKIIRDYGFVLMSFAALLPWLLHTIWNRRRSGSLKPTADELAYAFLILLAGLIFGVHLKRPMPYHEYVVIIVPVAALGAGIVWQRIWSSLPEASTRFLLVAGIVLMIAAGWGSQWVSVLELNGRRLPISRLQEVAAALAQEVQPGEKVYTFYPVIAYMADAEVPTPMAFPIHLTFFTPEDADRLHALQLEDLPLWLTDPSVTAVVGQDNPKKEWWTAETRQILARDFELVKTVPYVDLGSGPMNTFVYRRVATPPAATAADDAPEPATRQDD